jgi:hypothetical protein
MSCTVIDHTPYHFQNVSNHLFTTSTVYARNMRCLFMQYAPHIHRTALSTKPTCNANKAKQKHPIWEQQTLDLQFKEYILAMQTTNTDNTNYNQCFSVECFLVLIYSNPNAKK